MNIIIIGGGAAGFFAAINIAEKNKNYSITILEKSSKLLSKVRVSGGGRCNVTNACFDNNELIKNYPRGEKELRSVFSRFSTSDTIEWFKQNGVELKTEIDGRIFPISNNSETIINCFLKKAESLNVSIKLNTDIKKIEKRENKFSLYTKEGGQFQCDKLIIATGGNSKPEAYQLINTLGHTIVKPVPSLFTFNIPNNPITKLMGVSVPYAKVKVGQTKLSTEGPLLITHWGLSGPAILKASAWGARLLHDFNYNFDVFIHWLPKLTEEKLRIELNNYKKEEATKLILNSSPFDLPKRLWEYLVLKSNIQPETRWADISKKQSNILTSNIFNDKYKVMGKTTFKEEFVTCGGVSLKEINLSTMESKLVPNLYFAGEIIDVDGITGGFNFQNAWSTAWIIAKSFN